MSLKEKIRIIAAALFLVNIAVLFLGCVVLRSAAVSIVGLVALFFTTAAAFAASSWADNDGRHSWWRNSGL